MNAKKIPLISFFTFLLLIILTNLVNAQEDFIATSLPSIELCPCSNQAYKVAVQNTGAIASSYRVLASGTAKEWVVFNPNKFVLNPGQKGSFSAIVNSECNIEGDYSLEIFIATSKGLTKVVKQALKFSQCYDYNLEQGNVLEKAEESIKFLQHEGSYLICRNEQKIMPILLTNNENFGNRYRLFLDAPEWALLNANNAALGAKSSGVFLISLDAMDAEGEFSFKLSAISELGKVQRKKDIKVNVEDCYALELELEKEMDVICSGEDKTYSILIKNPLALERNVKLELDAPEWAGLENVSFAELKSGEEKTLTLSLSPEDDVSGSFLVNISALIENKSKIADEIKIDVVPKRECYKAEIDAKTSINNFYNEDFFFAKVKNNGIKKITYNINLEGVSWVSINPKTLELNPGQTGNLNLNVNPGKDIEPGTYGVKIILKNEDMLYSKNVDIMLKNENEFARKFKATIRFYRYYIYLLILLIVLIIIFIKPVKKIKNKAKKSYEKYKVKRERLEASKLAREEREKEETKEKKEKKKPIKKESGKKFKIFLKKYKIWIYILILLLIAALGIFLGHYYKLFNAKYLHIYIINFFYGYLYYLLIGIGIVILLFLLILLYNKISKKGKKKIEARKEEQKAEKRAKSKKKFYMPHYKILFLVLSAIIIYGIYFFGLAKSIKDFFVLYLYYIILGIAMLVLIILLIRFYKPLLRFLRE